MAIAHALPAQAVSVQPLGGALHDEKTSALFKSDQIEVMRLVLRAGRSMPVHRAPGEITVQCIEGSLDVTIDGESHVLRAGELMYLPSGEPHGVRALTDASALVTMVLRH